jgi:hypothetical protein
MIHEHANLKPLALAVVSQAVRDLQGGDTIRSLDAALWLTSDDFDFWREVADIPNANSYRLLTGGNVRRMRTGRK